MTRAELKQEVTDVITTNGNREITGEVMRTLLHLMIDNMPVLGVDNGVRPYNPASVYQPGDVAIYDGQLIGCNTADTTGAFDLSKWDVLAGMKVVADNTERDGLIVRHEGMECFVLADGKKYQLIGGVGNGDWTQTNGDQIHVFTTTPTSNGQVNFTIPDREIISFKVNGAEEPSSTYTLSGGDGTEQNLEWTSEDFDMDTDDDISIIYKGEEVIIS